MVIRCSARFKRSTLLFNLHGARKKVELEVECWPALSASPLKIWRFGERNFNVIIWAVNKNERDKPTDGDVAKNAEEESESG